MTHEEDVRTTRLEFVFGETFPANDPVAQYVARLSIALGDLRTAAKFATRADQPDHERVYFVRLLASHLREILLLLEPSNGAIQIASVLDRLAADDPSSGPELRAARAEVGDRVREAMPGRPGVTLRDDLKRLRNGFFHYHHDAPATALLVEALKSVADQRGAYEVVERGDETHMRASYADDLATALDYPFGNITDEEAAALASEMHERIAGLIEPLSKYLHHAEAAYLSSRGTVTAILPNGSRGPYGPGRS